MTDRDDSLPPHVQRSLDGLPRELPPDPALEARVVHALIASGDIGRARRRPRWPWITVAAVAAAAALVFAVGLPWLRAPRPAPGAAYVLLLYEDSTFRHPAPGHGAERVAEYARWADRLAALLKLERGAALAGPGQITGLFIVRAASDADAARLAASCPHTKYSGRVETRRLIE
jgi:hypothetical protein